MDDQRIPGRPLLGGKYLRHRRRIKRIRAQSVDRFRGKSDRASTAQDARRHREVRRLTGARLGADSKPQRLDARVTFVQFLAFPSPGHLTGLYVKSMSAVEVEIKFQVADPAAFVAKLEALGFRELTPSSLERNTLFDTPEHSMRAARTILRIRHYDGRWLLTHKCLPPNYDQFERFKHRIETETEVADGEALATIFKSLGYSESFVYEKWRAEYADDTAHCVVDRTPIGTFAELEGPEEWIDKIAYHLGLAEELMLTASYGKLFEQWRRETGSTAQNMTFAEIEPQL